MFLSMQLICFMLQVFALAKFILETKEIIIMFNVVKKKFNVITFSKYFVSYSLLE